jgi:hypothetical protein
MVGRWFRMYDAVLDDPKVQRLPDPAFRAWVNLMCLASRSDGHIAKNWDDISFALRAPIGDAKDIVAALVRARLIDEKKHWYEPHNWKTRQYKSDVSTARVKRFRSAAKSLQETPPEQKQMQSQNRAEQNKDARAARFEEFYLAYPRKEARGAAKKAWGAAAALASAETLIAAARAYGAKRSGEDKKFTKLASTWLNAKCWETRALRPLRFLTPTRRRKSRTVPTG